MAIRRILAGILFPLCCAEAAVAQSLGIAHRPLDPRVVPERSRDRTPVPAAVAIPIIEDASGVSRKGMIGSWPITEGLSADIGLIEVSRDHRRDRTLRRLHPMKDVGAQTDRIAAVGLNLRF